MLLTILALQTAGAAQVYHGRDGNVSVEPPRLEAVVEIDGRLDETAWRSASVLTGFSQYLPVDGRAAVDSTEVFVWYAPDAIYFGIRAFEPHGEVRATLADRDRIETDDHVQILLDTFDDRRRAFVFGVNPLGVQGDGIRTEGAFGTGGGQDRSDGRFENVDMNPDFVFESKGRLTEFGYEVEVRIPFKSIAYQNATTQRWAVNVIRKIQHSAYEDTWTATQRASVSFLSQSGTLEGLTDLRRGLVMDLNPFTTGRVDGAPVASGTWEYDVTPEIGLNASWGITTNLSLDATVNPDFSQVEADVGQVSVNERFALFFPEKRPFFLEGIEQFNTPNTLIYTRRIANPLGGLKLTGKVSGTDVAVLSTVGEKIASESGDENPVVSALRIRRDIGENSTAGLAYTDRIEGDDFNRVAATDVRLTFGEIYFVQVQGGASVTRRSGTTLTGPIWDVILDRTGRNWGFHYSLKGYHPDFEAGSGFVPRTGVVTPFFANRLSAYGSEGSTLENWTGFFLFTGAWDYDEFFDGGGPLETSFGNSSFFTLKGGWSIGLNADWRTVDFDPEFYSSYRVDNGADTSGFQLPTRLTNLYAMSASASTPEFATFAASVNVGTGRQAAFFEPAVAGSFSGRATLDWRPNDRVRVQTSYVYARLNRSRDGSRLSTARIPRLKIEYQLSRPIFFRFVGQYQSQEQDALRDPVTDRPILVVEDDGSVVSASSSTTNDFRLDWLFSYRPVPGTVFFAGYGSSLTESSSFSFRDLQRTQDGFFLKLSYLFRL